MKYSLSRLGYFIQPIDNRNSDNRIELLRGVSTTKNLIESVANMTGVETVGYKVVDTNQFVYVDDTSRRGDKIALALNSGEPCFVSSIYTVFEIKDNSELLPEYLFLWFNRSEFDRYARFHSWGSARETFDWDEMSEVRLPIPDITEQKKYVALYNGLMNNQKSYEKSLDDLQLICDAYMEALGKTEEFKELGAYIQQSEEKNSNLNVKNLLAISVNKIFLPSKTNQDDIDFAGYKIVRKRQFGYVTVTSSKANAY